MNKQLKSNPAFISWLKEYVGAQQRGPCRESLETVTNHVRSVAHPTWNIYAPQTYGTLLKIYTNNTTFNIVERGANLVLEVTCNLLTREKLSITNWDIALLDTILAKNQEAADYKLAVKTKKKKKEKLQDIGYDAKYNNYCAEKQYDITVTTTSDTIQASNKNRSVVVVIHTRWKKNSDILFDDVKFKEFLDNISPMFNLKKTKGHIEGMEARIRFWE